MSTNEITTETMKAIAEVNARQGREMEEAIGPIYDSAAKRAAKRREQRKDAREAQE